MDAPRFLLTGATPPAMGMRRTGRDVPWRHLALARVAVPLRGGGGCGRDAAGKQVRLLPTAVPTGPAQRGVCRRSWPVVLISPRRGEPVGGRRCCHRRRLRYIAMAPARRGSSCAYVLGHTELLQRDKRGLPRHERCAAHHRIHTFIATEAAVWETLRITHDPALLGWLALPHKARGANLTRVRAASLAGRGDRFRRRSRADRLPGGLRASDGRGNGVDLPLEQPALARVRIEPRDSDAAARPAQQPAKWSWVMRSVSTPPPRCGLDRGAQRDVDADEHGAQHIVRQHHAHRQLGRQQAARLRGDALQQLGVAGHIDTGGGQRRLVQGAVTMAPTSPRSAAWAAAMTASAAARPATALTCQSAAAPGSTPRATRACTGGGTRPACAGPSSTAIGSSPRPPAPPAASRPHPPPPRSGTTTGPAPEHLGHDLPARCRPHPPW